MSSKKSQGDGNLSEQGMEGDSCEGSADPTVETLYVDHSVTLTLTKESLVVFGTDTFAKAS